MTAAEALAIGLANRVVPDADVYQAAREPRRPGTRSGPALRLRAAKQAVNMGLEVDLATALEIERLHFAGLFATADQKAACAALWRMARERQSSRGVRRNPATKLEKA